MNAWAFLNCWDGACPGCPPKYTPMHLWMYTSVLLLIDDEHALRCAKHLCRSFIKGLNIQQLPYFMWPFVLQLSYSIPLIEKLHQSARNTHGRPPQVSTSGRF